ncbi:MAG: ABC transporter permease subunit [Acidimicrobiia bacterium]
MLAFEVPKQLVFSGAVTGVTYGVIAIGLILIFRSTRVINFAIAEMGGFAAAVLARMVLNWGVGYWLSFVCCLGIGALVGAALELLIVRRLFTAPRVIMLVATIGAAQLLLFAQAILPEPKGLQPFPTAFSRTWEVGGVIVHSEDLVVLIVMPLVIAALALFLNRTKYGLAIRASAANPDAARLSAISVKKMSTLVWVLAGTLTAIGTILWAPLTANTATDTFSLGPTLLLRALTAALIAGMTSLPVALGAGIVIGVGESVLLYNNDTPGILDAALFVVVLIALLVMARNQRSAETGGAWSFSPRVRPTPASLEHVWWVRRLSRMSGIVALLVALTPLVIFTRASQQLLWSRMLLYALVALSLTVLTGWAGQLSLGQFAFVGLGAMSTGALVRNGVGFVPALVLSAAVGAAAAMIVGVPALRRPGLFLAVSTLAFAVMTASWLLFRPVFLPANVLSVSIPRQIIGRVNLGSQGTYYAICLVVLVVLMLGISRVRHSGLGRSMIAVRDNERAAAALGLSPTRVKLTAFGISGAIAGLAGGLLAGLLVTFEPALFSATESLNVVSIAVIGGLASVPGAVLGAFWVVGLPALFNNSNTVGLLTSGAGLLILLLYFPAGLVQLGYSIRDMWFARVASRRPSDVAPVIIAPLTSTRLPPGPSVPADIDTLIRVRDLTVRFASRTVVDGVDLEVRRGEVVGLIGSNGAGKSTLMNAIAGFVPSGGTIEVLGRDVRRMPPARRARLGLGRSFQGAELFGDLTVRETIETSLESRAHAGLVATVLALPRARRLERVKRREADEIVGFLGLGRFSGSFINELSTGTRRIVELACLMGSGARILCLDEPTAGIAQRESEAFGPLILDIRRELDASLLVIEHDMPLVLGISDRVYCLEAGRIICEGAPDAVRNDPLVVASYLGTDAAAIQRSGTRPAGLAT